jgi:mono/diheme cytochrome c family protein
LAQARKLGLVIVILVALAACGDREKRAQGSLRFEREGRVVETLSLAALAAQGARTVATNDPYYQAPKRFRALPLAPLLETVYGEPVAQLKQRSFVLYALDGYAVPIEGERLLEGGAHLALDDLDVPGFAPIGPNKVSPAPLYMFWAGDAHADLETHPRPWQLAKVAIVDPDALYPHTVPRGEPPDSPALHGQRLFRERCIRCHAINREGGRVGPDLNVPRSIVDYRPEEQIRAYIRDPLSFRYGAMPANPDLSDADLSALVAYFRAMSKHPHDPEAKPSP